MATDEETQPVIADLHQTRMTPAEEPPFHEELADVWGKRWGAWDEVGKLRSVLVRPPGPALDRIDSGAYVADMDAFVDPDGQWYWTGSEPPDIARAAAQHEGLIATLKDEGVDVVVAPPMGERFSKAMYVRDPLVTVPGGAIIGRLAVQMRRGEEPDITRAVADAGLPILATLTGTATLEGGSFMKLRDGVAALGLSIRCNQAGADQLGEVLARIGWELIVIPLPGYTIHLDLHLALVDRDVALIDPTGLPYVFLQQLERLGFRTIPVDPSEPWGINLLTLSPGRVLMAEGSPRSQERLRAAGIEVITIPYDELHHNGGGIHCSTMELMRDPA